MKILYKQESDRWVKGDRLIRPFVRKLIRRNSSRESGMQKVVSNFLKGLNIAGIKYEFNRTARFNNRNSDKIISFGLGKLGLQGVKKDNPLIAAIGFPYPSEIPSLTDDYNVKKFLQHSDWVLDFARSANIYDSSIFEIWPAGIDTNDWIPILKMPDKKYDVLIYNKIYWDEDNVNLALVQPIRNFLRTNGYSFVEIKYGKYENMEFKRLLNESKVMIFLSAHESQGLAYQECMSCNVPVFAWDQGYWLDPIRFTYNKPIVKATSVPYFDQRCGMKFLNFKEFTLNFNEFFESSLMNHFASRDYVLENLSIERSTQKMIDIYNSI